MDQGWAFVDGLADGLGAEEIVLLRNAVSGVRAVVVVDNTACGPGIGGLRMAPDVTVGEVARLARAMTLKSAAAGLAHGGAKAGLVADPAMTPRDKESLVRWFAQAIRDVHAYIPGPDMGTDERCMAWIHDEIGRSVGLPEVLGGIPLDELGATAFGLAVAAEVARTHSRRAASGGRGWRSRASARSASTPPASWPSGTRRSCPVTPKAEMMLHERGVVCLPDWIVNAGGLICASVEYDGGTRTEAFDRIEAQIRSNTAAVLDRALREGWMPRSVAEEIAWERVTDAAALRRWSVAPALSR